MLENRVWSKGLALFHIALSVLFHVYAFLLSTFLYFVYNKHSMVTFKRGFSGLFRPNHPTNCRKKTRATCTLAHYIRCVSDKILNKYIKKWLIFQARHFGPFEGQSFTFQRGKSSSSSIDVFLYTNF